MNLSIDVDNDYEDIKMKSLEVRTDQNECYGVAAKKSEARNPPLDQSHKQQCKVTLMVMLLNVFLAVSTAVLIIAVMVTENSKLRKEVSEVKEQMMEAVPDVRDKLNGSSTVSALSRNTSSFSSSFGECSTCDSVSGSSKRLNDTISKLVNDLQMTVTFDSCVAVSLLALPFPSGKYWIKSASSPVQQHCDMNFTCNGISGDWKRIAYLNASDNRSSCPSGLHFQSSPPSCSLTRPREGCTSVIYKTYGTPFSQICGTIRGIYNNIFEQFPDHSDLEDNYVNGVSLTYGEENNRTHIWTFASQRSCLQCRARTPDFARGHYSCSLARRGRDGNQCVGDGGWFHRELPQFIMEDIEMRVCRQERLDDADIMITFVDIYVK